MSRGEKQEKCIFYGKRPADITLSNKKLQQLINELQNKYREFFKSAIK